MFGDMFLFDFLVGRATKPRLLGYMLPNINIFENEYWYFSYNFKIVALKLFELTDLISPKNINLLQFRMALGSVVMSTFSN